MIRTKTLLSLTSPLLLTAVLYGESGPKDKPMEDMRRVINVTPVSPYGDDATVNDLIRLKRECGVTDAAFMMSLRPEGAPLMAKPQKMMKDFVRIRQKLRGRGPRAGILVQSLLGHGDRGRAICEIPFQRIVKSDGTSNEKMCPLDEGFRRYARDVAALLSSEKPAFLLIDDDFRILGDACYCDKHLAAFNKAMGGDYTRDELVEALGKTDPKSVEMGKVWNNVLIDSMVGLAKAIREGVDSVDPSIPCGYCTTLYDLSYMRPITFALAGKTPPFVRVNGACYMEDRPSFIPIRMRQIATQAAYLNDIPEILLEADTWPQERYSCSAAYLRAFIAASLVNGATGRLQWITKTFDSQDPQVGEAYRTMTRDNKGLFEALAELDVEWDGPRVPLPETPPNDWNPVKKARQTQARSWHDSLARLGIPVRMGGSGDVALLTGDEVDFFTDPELKKLLEGKLILDGRAAQKLSERGFSEYLGIVAIDSKKRVSAEKFLDDPRQTAASIMNGGFPTRELRVIDKNTEVLSQVLFHPWSNHPNPKVMFPGLTLFKNKLGGQVAVYAISMINSGFGVLQNNFISHPRKKQLLRLLDRLDPTGARCVALDDVNLYVKQGRTKDGKRIGCLFNVSLDTLSTPRLRLKGGAPANPLRLSTTGAWEPLACREIDDTIVIDQELRPLEPLVIKYDEKR